MVVSLPKVPVHESSVHTAEPGDAVEDVSPQIEIVPLMDDPVVIFFITLAGNKDQHP